MNDSLRTRQVQARLVAFGDIAPLVPSDSLRSSSAPTLRVPRRPVQARPSPASALPRALVSGPVQEPPPVCSTRPSSLPPALTATQSPWRLPSAGFSGTVSPSLVPLVPSFLTACAGSGSHTPRSPLQGRPVRINACPEAAKPRPWASRSCWIESMLPSIAAIILISFTFPRRGSLGNREIHPAMLGRTTPSGPSSPGSSPGTGPTSVVPASDPAPVSCPAALTNPDVNGKEHRHESPWGLGVRPRCRGRRQGHSARQRRRGD